jgi:hypothetical protein
MDDQSQPRIAEEADAVEHIFRLLRMKTIEWLPSIALEAETRNNPDTERRCEVEVLLLLATNTIPLDDRFIRRAARAIGSPRVRVLNPVECLRADGMTSVEHMTDEQFERYALEVLQREIGSDGLARFLRLNRSGKGDYTRDRLEWQKNLSVAGIVASLNSPDSQ